MEPEPRSLANCRRVVDRGRPVIRARSAALRRPSSVSASTSSRYGGAHGLMALVRSGRTVGSETSASVAAARGSRPPMRHWLAPRWSWPTRWVRIPVTPGTAGRRSSRISARSLWSSPAILITTPNSRAAISAVTTIGHAASSCANDITRPAAQAISVMARRFPWTPSTDGYAITQDRPLSLRRAHLLLSVAGPSPRASASCRHDARGRSCSAWMSEISASSSASIADVSQLHASVSGLFNLRGPSGT